MDRRRLLAGTAALLAAGRPARADVATVRIGVGGKPLLYYLPLTIAERKGFFTEEGIAAEISDFGGGARSLQALIGGSVDVVTGAYEHTIRMQAKGQDVRAVCELGRFPAIVIAVRKDLAGTVRSVADLKGRKIGVTAPGSSTALAVQFAMIKAGLKASDAPLIGIGGGAGAIAAIKRAEVDAIAHLDPVIAKLEADGDDPDPRRYAHRGRDPRPVRRPEPGGGGLRQAGLDRASPGRDAEGGQRLRQGVEVARRRHARGRRRPRARRLSVRRPRALPAGGEELAGQLLAHRHPHRRRHE